MKKEIIYNRFKSNYCIQKEREVRKIFLKRFNVSGVAIDNIEILTFIEKSIFQ